MMVLRQVTTDLGHPIRSRFRDLQQPRQTNPPPSPPPAIAPPRPKRLFVPPLPVDRPRDHRREQGHQEHPWRAQEERFLFP